MREKNLSVSLDIQKSLMLGSLWHPIDKAGRTTLFSSENTFSTGSLSAKKLKSFINDNDNKDNQNNAREWILTSYVLQKKINKIDHDLDS